MSTKLSVYVDWLLTLIPRSESLFYIGMEENDIHVAMVSVKNYLENLTKITLSQGRYKGRKDCLF